MSSGGGGNTTVASTGIDEEFKPYLKEVLGDVTSRYKSEIEGGPDTVVAALDPAQKRALEMQKKMAEQAMSGTGLYDTKGAQERDLKNLLGSQMGQAYTGGALGSARSQKATQGALADRALQYQQRRQQEAVGGIDALGEAGSTLQQYAQSKLDAPYTSASRYFGYLGNAPQQTTQTTAGGGK